MIYLDNAATTWPKPPVVIEAMEKVLTQMGANPGRAAHGMALMASRTIVKARESIARLFNIPDASCIVFGPNATFALNQAIKGFLKPGDHVVTTSMEHNSVFRPLWSLQKQGVKISIVQCSETGQLDVEKLEKALQPNTALIVMTHASNVTGTLLPVKEVGEVATARGVKLLLDAAQTAGVYPIDVQELHIDMLAFPGHKGLLGPQGTGGLYVREGIELIPLLEGGTGGNSESPEQPQVMPDRLESGTHNTAGIAGLGAAVDYIMEQTVDKVRRHERELVAHFLDGVKKIPGITIYGPQNPEQKVGVVSLNVANADCGEIGYLLDHVYGIGVRTGLHCAPNAHRTIGTLESGTVRVSFSYFNTHDDVEHCLKALSEIAGNLG